MAYDLENWGGLNRASFNALISERDQVEYYYPAWRAAVQGGRTGSIMCSCESRPHLPSIIIQQIIIAMSDIAMSD